jgi:membrane protein YdbS with pleckstrin-like domain
VTTHSDERERALEAAPHAARTAQTNPAANVMASGLTHSLHAEAVASAMAPDTPRTGKASDTADHDTPRALAPRVRTAWRLDFAVNALIVSVGLGVLAWFVGPGTQWVRVAVAVAAPWCLAVPAAIRLPDRRYHAWRYQLTPDALRLERGVMFRTESVVPYTRIQHVDTAQGPVERLLGLTRVTVHTASGTSSSLTIPGLTPDDADRLREQLATRAGMVEPL